MQIGIAGILAILLGLALTLGSCAGVNTSQIEDLADGLGIEPVDISFAGSSEEDDFSWDDLDLATTWVMVDTAEECAEGAGVGTFPDIKSIEIGRGAPDVSYAYEEGHAQAVCFYPGFFLFVDKALYANADSIVGDDRTFDLEWTVTIKGIEVACSGYEEGVTCNAIFADGNCVYSIQAIGPDDNPNQGLNATELEAFVTALL